jgi:hypothetical protein
MFDPSIIEMGDLYLSDVRLGKIAQISTPLPLHKPQHLSTPPFDDARRLAHTVGQVAYVHFDGVETADKVVGLAFPNQSALSVTTTAICFWPFCRFSKHGQ